MGRTIIDRRNALMELPTRPAPLDVVPVADDEFRIRVGDQAYSGVVAASLRFHRSAGGAIAGVRLSSGTERGLVFEKLR